MYVENITSYEKVDEIIDFLSTCDTIYFDTETTGLDPYTSKLLILSLYANDGITKRAFTFDIVCMGVEILYSLKPILEDPSSVKVAHNTIFDWKMLYHNGNIYTSPVYCTLIGEQVLKSGLLFSGFGLDDVVKRRLDIDMDKSIRVQFIDRDTSIPFTDDELAYAAEDTVVLEPIYQQQKNEIQKQGLSKVIDVECQLIPITSQLEYNGVCIDESKLDAARPVVEKIIQDATARLQDEIIRAGAASEISFDRNGYIAVNTGSPKQMLEAFNEMGINVPSLGKKELSDWDAKWAQKQGALSSAGGDDELDVGYAHPVLKQHAIRTAAAKLQGTYIDGLKSRINPVTKRVHPGYKQCGAPATGRMSSVSPNMQNLPQQQKLIVLGMQDHDIRSMFIPAPGCGFIICDYSGIELAILAAMSGDTELTYQILRGDIHSFVANSLAGDAIQNAIGSLITPENKKKDKTAKAIRDLFKPVSYGIIYGSTGYNLYRTLYFSLRALGIHIVQTDTDRWVDEWKNKLFPQTGKLLEQNAHYAVTRYYTESALGRKRYWTDDIRYDKWRMLAAMREGSNHPIQASCSDMLKRAMINLDAALDRSVARIVAPVHDELLVESNVACIDTVAELTKLHMEAAARELYPDADKDLFTANPVVSNRYDK